MTFMDGSILPSVNASLNATSAFFLALGYFFIRRRALVQHKACMLGACITSVLFLASYITYHAVHGSTRFQGQGWIRPVYFSILISHTILAVAVVPLVIITLTRALKGVFHKHVWIGRITLPIWFYVSVTGVVVYWMLYHLHFT